MNKNIGFHHRSSWKQFNGFAAYLMAVATPCFAQNGAVIPTGAMRNTMFNGQLAGIIQLDSLATPGTYGIGPLEFLRGEVLVLDGTVLVSTATLESSMAVQQRPNVRAPFFVHQRVAEWTSIALPDSVADLPLLDAFLTARFATIGRPFAFRLQGTFSSVHVHILDVPLGTIVHGPNDAHRHNKHYQAEDRTLDLVGFFSTQHKGVFTHHDANIHAHAITNERDWMGHVEGMRFVPGLVKLEVALPGH